MLDRATGETKTIDFGNVGDVLQINADLLKLLLENNYLPVVSSLGADSDGSIFNINADTIASEVAAQLKAEKLILMSDVNGIYLDANDESTKLSQISVMEAEAMINSGKATGGMIPKLQSLISILERGVKSAHIIGGNVRNALLSEVFTDEGTGTMISS